MKRWFILAITISLVLSACSIEKTGQALSPLKDSGASCPPCTAHDPDGPSGNCNWLLDGGTCDDKNACTTSDTCSNGKCIGGKPKCGKDELCCSGGVCIPYDNGNGCCTVQDCGKTSSQCRVVVCKDNQCDQPLKEGAECDASVEWGEGYCDDKNNQTDDICQNDCTCANPPNTLS